MELVNNIYCLYRHIRPDNNEVFYVGIGDEDRPYKKGKYRNTYWRNIVNKNNGEYGIDILLDNISWNFAKQKEVEFIKLYGRADLGLGTLVNLTDGGDGTVNRVTSKETAEKIRNGNIGRVLTDSHIKILSEVVYQVSLVGEVLNKYPSMREAERQTGIKNGEISLVCKQRLKTTGGFIWLYEDDLFRLENIRNKLNTVGCGRSVIQSTKEGCFIKKWNNISLVEQELSIHVTSISAVCNGKRKSAGGFLWQYEQLKHKLAA